MLKFGEQPQVKLTADVKSGDVSVAERMEALHGLVKKGRKPEEEHDYVKEALRIVSAMYAGIELPKNMEPQSVEFPPDVTITLKGEPKISADGKSFSVVFDDQGFNKYLIVSDRQEKQIKNNREVFEIETVAGPVYQVNNDHGGFVLYDEKETKIFDTEVSATENSNNQISAEGVSFWNKEPKAMGFFSFKNRQIYLYTEDVDSAQVLAGKTVLVYKNINDKDKKKAVRINERVFEKKYSEIHKVFEHEGKISFIASQQDRWGRKILWVDEKGKEKVLHSEIRLGFDGKPEYNTVDVVVKDSQLSVGIRKGDGAFDSEDKYQYRVDCSLSGTKLAENCIVHHLGKQKGLDIFAILSAGFSPLLKIQVVDENNHVILSDRNLRFMDGNHLQVGDDIFLIRKIEDGDQEKFEVFNLFGDVVPMTFREKPKLISLTGKLIILEEDTRMPGETFKHYFNEKGEKLAINKMAVDVCDHFGEIAVSSKKRNGSVSLLNAQGDLLFEDVGFSPDSFMEINNRQYGFANLNVKNRFKFVFDVKNSQTVIFSACLLASDDQVLLVGRMAKTPGTDPMWGAFDYDLNPIGEPYDDVYDTRINNGKVWVLGKRGNQIVYEPAGGVDNT